MVGREEVSQSSGMGERVREAGRECLRGVLVRKERVSFMVLLT